MSFFRKNDPAWKSSCDTAPRTAQEKSANPLDCDVRDLPLLLVLFVCVLGGWIFAAYTLGAGSSPFFELLFNVRFLGFAFTYIFLLFAAALVGWLLAWLLFGRRGAAWGALICALLTVYMQYQGGEIQKARASYDQTVTKLEGKYPELNPDSPKYRPAISQGIMTQKARYVQQGMSEPDALHAAVADSGRK
jgi:hypothetical protein